MSGPWAHLSWREPLWLLLALVPWTVWLWQRRRRGPGSGMARYADPHLWPWLLVGAPRLGHGTLVTVAWLLAAIAAAGPQWDSASQEQQARRGIDIMTVVDISPSMLTTDVSPSRLGRAKLKLRDFVHLLHGDRVGLVPFSANAYLTLPLTHDRDAFTYFVSALNPELVSKTGSNLQRALSVAGQALQAGGRQGKAIVLLSDGESHGPPSLSTARALGRAGIPLYILGMGTVDGGPVPTPRGQFMKFDGHVVVSHLKRARLRRLAEASGGAYTDLRDDDGDWKTLFKAMRGHVPENRYSITTASPNRALFPWFLAASLALFLFAGLSRTQPALLALALLIPFGTPQPAYAWPWQEQAALKALNGGEYARAVKLYRRVAGYKGYLGTGAGLYRLRDYAAAADQFRRAAAAAGSAGERAKAEYDLGNAYARLGRLDRAAEAYRRALRARPDYPHAALNLSLISKTRQNRAGRHASPEAERSRPERASQGKTAKPPLGAPRGRVPRRRASGTAAGAPSGAVGSRERPPTAREHTSPLLKAWKLKPGDLDEDLSAALERLKSVRARPGVLMNFFYTQQDIEAGITTQTKRW